MLQGTSCKGSLMDDCSQCLLSTLTLVLGLQGWVTWSEELRDWEGGGDANVSPLDGSQGGPSEDQASIPSSSVSPALFRSSLTLLLTLSSVTMA
jgi:hypothetical protein